VKPVDDTRKERRLYVAPLRGRFLILEPVITELERVLPTYRGPDGHHEGIAFLCGFERAGETVFTTAIFPDAEHRAGYVRCDEAQFAAASSAARSYGLGLLAQVHTHPKGCTGHSWGDDNMVRPAYEGMLSIVVPDYGLTGLRPLDSLGIHQLQGTQWILAERASIREKVLIIPAGRDLR
jgi:hypothetical protein